MTLYLVRQRNVKVCVCFCESHQAQQIYLKIKSLLQLLVLSPGHAFVFDLTIFWLIHSNLAYLWLLESSFVGTK